MKTFLGLAILATSALWADEATDRAAVEKTITALNTSPTPADIFTADFPNAAELQRFQMPLGTLIISREPMGEATWIPAASSIGFAVPRFVTRSATFITSDTAVVVAAYSQQTVLFVLKRGASDWKIASFRVIPEAQSKIL